MRYDVETKKNVKRDPEEKFGAWLFCKQTTKIAGANSTLCKTDPIIRSLETANDYDRIAILL